MTLNPARRRHASFKSWDEGYYPSWKLYGWSRQWSIWKQSIGEIYLIRKGTRGTALVASRSAAILIQVYAPSYYHPVYHIGVRFTVVPGAPWPIFHKWEWPRIAFRGIESEMAMLMRCFPPQGHLPVRGMPFIFHCSICIRSNRTLLGEQL